MKYWVFNTVWRGSVSAWFVCSTTFWVLHCRYHPCATCSDTSPCHQPQPHWCFPLSCKDSQMVPGNFMWMIPALIYTELPSSAFVTPRYGGHITNTKDFKLYYLDLHQCPLAVLLTLAFLVFLFVSLPHRLQSTHCPVSTSWMGKCHTEKFLI